MILWTLGQLALAAPEPPPGPEPAKQERSLRLPPLRLGGGAAFRSGSFSGGELELGVQPWRSRVLSLEVYGRYQSPQLLALPGAAPRDILTWTGSLGLLLHLGPMVAVGPELGVGARLYRMEWWTVGVAPVPMVAGQAQVGILRTGTWGLALTVRMSVEPVPQVLSLHTQEVTTLSPVQAMVGTRLLLGHGRVDGERM